MAKLTKDEILAYLDEATILELNELVKAIEEKYGVSAAAPYFSSIAFTRSLSSRIVASSRNARISSFVNFAIFFFLLRQPLPQRVLFLLQEQQPLQVHRQLV